MSIPSHELNAGSNVPSLDPALILGSTDAQPGKVFASQYEHKRSSILSPEEVELRPWATVLVGRRPGVYFESGDDVMANVSGIPGSIVLKYAKEVDARNKFSTSLNEGHVERVILQHERTVITPSPEEPLVLSAEIPGVRRWRVVFVGRQPGIFADKSEILSNVLNIPGARSRKFESYDVATAAFLRAVAAGEVEQVVWKLTRETLTRSFFESL